TRKWRTYGSLAAVQVTGSSTVRLWASIWPDSSSTQPGLSQDFRWRPKKRCRNEPFTDCSDRLILRVWERGGEDSAARECAWPAWLSRRRAAGPPRKAIFRYARHRRGT